MFVDRATFITHRQRINTLFPIFKRELVSHKQRWFKGRLHGLVSRGFSPEMTESARKRKTGVGRVQTQLLPHPSPPLRVHHTR